MVPPVPHEVTDSLDDSFPASSLQYLSCSFSHVHTISVSRSIRVQYSPLRTTNSHFVSYQCLHYCPLVSHLCLVLSYISATPLPSLFMVPREKVLPQRKEVFPTS